MARLNERIFGYYKGRVAQGESCKLANAFLKLGICSDITPDGDFSLKREDKSVFTGYARAKFRYSLSRPLGLYGSFLRLLHSYGVILALLVSVIVFSFSLGRVWDVRINGNDRLTDYEIERSLNECGLNIGIGWRSIDKEQLESEILMQNPEIAWISVNRRGTVAYVEIIESENLSLGSENEYSFSNVVADRDGVIEEITVESGVAVVKPGDVVKAGDVLISGVVENEKGVSFCRAKGSVLAQGAVDMKAEALESYVEKVPTRHKLVELRLIIFDFSINIFKNYGNCENSCDIIKENRNIALFDSFRLPIRIERAYASQYEERYVTRSPDDTADVAKRALDGMIYTSFKNAHVLRIRTDGEFKDGSYRITARVVYLSEIGKESELEVN